MFLRLLILFITLPIVELMLLLKLSELTNWPVTIAIVLGTGLIGASLARWQGWRTVQRMREEWAAGRAPTDAIGDGALILVAGALLIAPGLLTDTVGLLLLIPAVRRFARQRMLRRFQQNFVLRQSGDGWTTYEYQSRGRDEIIDARVVGPTRIESIHDEK